MEISPSDDYGLNLQDFANSMIKRIQQNMTAKGLSWRGMPETYLILLLLKYVSRKAVMTLPFWSARRALLIWLFIDVRNRI